MNDSISAEDYLRGSEGTTARQKGNKYGAVKTVVDGISFSSKAEARRYGELKLLLRAGNIDELVLQPKFPLVVEGVKIGTYIADFSYFDVLTSKVVIEDVKGMMTPVYRIKKKLMKAIYGIEVWEVK